MRRLFRNEYGAREADEGKKSHKIGELRRIIVWFEGLESPKMEIPAQT
jgi:hypothetical protein